MPFTTKLWYFLRVASYPCVNATESSVDVFACAACSALHVKASPRSSHIKPSVAVRFFSPFSFSTSSSRVAHFSGAASYRARTFCGQKEVEVGVAGVSNKTRVRRSPATHSDVTLDVALYGCERSRTEEICATRERRSPRVHFDTHRIAQEHPGTPQGRRGCRRQRRLLEHQRMTRLVSLIHITDLQRSVHALTVSR